MHIVRAEQVKQFESHKPQVLAPLLNWPAGHAPQVLLLIIKRLVEQLVQKVGYVRQVAQLPLQVTHDNLLALPASAPG